MGQQGFEISRCFGTRCRLHRRYPRSEPLQPAVNRSANGSALFRERRKAVGDPVERVLRTYSLWELYVGESRPGLPGDGLFWLHGAQKTQTSRRLSFFASLRSPSQNRNMSCKSPATCSVPAASHSPHHHPSTRSDSTDLVVKAHHFLCPRSCT